MLGVPQGAVLPSSNRGGIRVEYSKNPLGRKRDYGAFGAYGGSPAPMQSPPAPRPEEPASQEPAPMQTAAVSPQPDVKLEGDDEEAVKMEDGGVKMEDVAVTMEDGAPKPGEPHVKAEEAPQEESAQRAADDGAGQLADALAHRVGCLALQPGRADAASVTVQGCRPRRRHLTLWRKPRSPERLSGEARPCCR